MAKKPKNYKPQQRRPRNETPVAEYPSDSDRDAHPESSRDIPAVISELSHLFEIDTVIRGETSSSFLGSMTSAMIGSANLLKQVGVNLPIEELESADLEAYLPELVMAVREAVTSLKEEGFDVSESHAILPRLKFQELFKQMAEQQLNVFNMPTSILNNGNIEEFANAMIKSVPNIDPEKLAELNGIQFTAYSRLLRIYGSSRRIAKQVKEIDTYSVDIYDDYRDTALKGLERELDHNPNTVRRETTKALKYLLSDEVTAMLEHFGYTDDSSPQDDTEDTYNEASFESHNEYPPQELDFTILPVGTDLYEFAEEIVTRLQERELAHVDLKRVEVLSAIRDYIGKDRCYFAHGKKTGKQLEHEDGTLIDEDYIVLVMQELDETGFTTAEHALAISPIANKHAAYLTRYEASAGNWREILSLPKKDARYFGARDLKFTGSSGRTPYAMMYEKIKALLECSPDMFHDKLRMRADGTYRVGSLPRAVGQSAARHMVSIEN